MDVCGQGDGVRCTVIRQQAQEPVSESGVQELEGEPGRRAATGAVAECDHLYYASEVVGGELVRSQEWGLRSQLIRM